MSFLIVLIAGVSLGLLQEGLSAQQSIRHHEGNLRALEIAETGLIRAEEEIRALVDSDGTGIGALSGEYANGFFEVTSMNDPLNVDRWVLSARGEHGLCTRRVEVGLRRRASSRFVDVLFTQDNLTITKGILTDAYDSSKGTYSSQVTSSDGFGSFASPSGNIGSNGDVTVQGSNAVVRGNAIPGPLRVVEVRNGAQVSGDMLPRAEEVDMTPPSYAEFEQAYLLNSNANLALSVHHGVKYNPSTYSLTLSAGVTLHLPAGTYFLRDLKFVGNATIVLDGPVKIYGTNSLDFGGGVILNNGRPQDLLVYAHPYALPLGFTPSETTIKMRGGVDFVGAVYAPGAFLDASGGCRVFGAVAVKAATIGPGTILHQDLSLQGFQAKRAKLQRLYWRDAATPAR